MNAEILVILGILLGASVRYTMPILYAALGGLLAQKAGILNFALEGLMLGGAFFAYYGNLKTGSPWMGLLLALAVGAIVGIVLCIGILRYRVSQLVMGLGINVLFTGLTGYFFRLLTATGEPVVAENMVKAIRIPLLSRIPLLGEVLFSQNIFVYLSLVLVVLLSRFFGHTTIGLNLKAVGENPHAAASVGVDVMRYRALAIVASSMLATVGGAFLTLTLVSRFIENMVSGRGWIAIAAIILGKWSPKGVFWGCLIFGVATALSDQLQIMGINIPYQAALMVPYLLTMLVLTVNFGQGRSPAALGKKYQSE